LTELDDDAEDAVLEGDTPLLAGTVVAALRSRDFLLVWSGTFASNIGTWMQNVALGVFAYKLTKSAAFVGFLAFAQLGPLLILATVGGALADALDRRRLLVVMQSEQLLFSFALAGVAAAHHPSKTLVVLCVVAIGIGNALSGPALASLLPNLVPREHLAGAISLQSVQINLSRVIGPAIGGLLLPAVHVQGLFAINAVTYLFAVAGLVAAKATAGRRAPSADQGWRRLVGGFSVARRDPFVRQVLLTIASISLFCLPFISLMPVLAAKNLSMDVESLSYGLLYACFGLGATLGAMSVGTVFAVRSRALLVRLGTLGFALSLLVFALVRVASGGYPAAFFTGFFYFLAVTALSTALQEHLTDPIRGRVMALWIMGFGGIVPLGALAGGYIASRSSVTTVLIGGVVIALVIVLVTDLDRARRGGADTVPDLR
jgi:MFS family permease